MTYKNDLSKDLGVSGSAIGIATILILVVGFLLGLVVLAHWASMAEVAAATMVAIFLKPGYWPIEPTPENIRDAREDENCVVIAEDVLSEEITPFPPKLTLREQLERKCPLPFERLG